MSDRPAVSVSVVVPFYNSEATLAACIEALLAQEGVDDYEILLVDNRSTDASPRIAGQHADERGRLTVLEESTPGAYAARNTAIRQATAPIIAFTDADCVVDTDWLTAILDGLQDPQTAALIGHCRYPAESSWPLKRLGAYENAKADYVLTRCDPAYRFAYCNNMAVRASVFREIGLFEEWQRAGDSEFVHRLAVRRPDLQLVYRDSMRITHLEFTRVRDRARRLSLYTQTNSKIETFRELGIGHRLGVLRHWMRRRNR